MSVKLLCSIAFVSVVLKLQLCDASEIKSNSEDYQSSDNVTAAEEKDLNALTTMKSTEKLPVSNIKIVNQKYSQNTSGEYKHEVLFSNGNWRAEHGEYEDHNGANVFVIRGVFSYYTREGTYNTTLYIVDEFGYHSVQPPPLLTEDGAGSVDYRPDVQTASACGDDRESYCVDPKLLALLVG